MTYLTSRSSGTSILSLLFLFHFGFIDSSAQAPVMPDLLTPSVKLPVKTDRIIQENLNIIGVMVEFAPDANRFTSGNGTFGSGSIPYLENPGTNIDALPHNQSYFEAHLEFVKNYFETVSGNQISIEFDVLPEIFRLNRPMEDYSPTGENPDLSQMAELVADVWTVVGNSGELSVNVDDNQNTAFVIFHAGVGRDIELTGTTLDKTPQDLPSFYLNRDTLSDFLDDPSFSGFLINKGNLLVDNTLIIPRTLTRAGIDAAGNRYILPLSINGLLAAQVGSHLGLPDLFNTQTGQSGIGRFGLMDGAAIFSYNGLFPPEPSAWEKMFLGWNSIVSLDPESETTVELPASSIDRNRSIARVSLSKDEYFLIENRHRDPQGTGVTLTIKKSDGTYVNQTFTNQDSQFINQEPGFDRNLEPGVVVNSSNFDFSLPGGAVTVDNSGLSNYLNGGILIWHIDEGIIREKIQTGGVNNNPERRAVDLEEADGAQDIGQPTTVGLFQNEINGSPFDYWWSGNTASVIIQNDSLQIYENRFAPDTTPDNNSNSNAPSFFEFYDFSDTQRIASFNIRPVQPFTEIFELWDFKSNIEIETYSEIGNEYWIRYPHAAQPIFTKNEEWILIPGYSGIQFYQPETKFVTKAYLNDSTLQQPLIQDNTFTLAMNPIGQMNQLTVAIHQFDGNKPIEIDAFTVQPNTSFISAASKNILDIDGTNNQIDLNQKQVIKTEKTSQQSDRIGEYQSSITNNELIIQFPGGTERFGIGRENSFERWYTGIIQDMENRILFYLLQDGKLSIFSHNDQYSSERVIYETELIDWPAIADFNRDSQPDFLFTDYSANQLIAKNVNGAFLSNFPISAPEDVTFTGTPLIADLDGDTMNEILISGYDNYSMNIYAFDEKGEPFNGFPLYVGGIENVESQPIHPLIAGNKLIAVSHSGDLKVWQFKKMDSVQWRSKYGNQTRNKVSGFPDTKHLSSPQFTLLNRDETYNWPNPAKDETSIRFQTNGPAEIEIKILTLSGRLIGNHIFQSQGGVTEELFVDTSNWASGGYYALVEAKSDGRTDRKLVKIAIAK